MTDEGAASTYLGNIVRRIGMHIPLIRPFGPPSPQGEGFGAEPICYDKLPFIFPRGKFYEIDITRS